MQLEPLKRSISFVRYMINRVFKFSKGIRNAPFVKGFVIGNVNTYFLRVILILIYIDRFQFHHTDRTNNAILILKTVLNVLMFILDPAQNVFHLSKEA